MLGSHQASCLASAGNSLAIKCAVRLLAEHSCGLSVGHNIYSTQRNRVSANQPALTAVAAVAVCHCCRGRVLLLLPLPLVLPCHSVRARCSLPYLLTAQPGGDSRPPPPRPSGKRPHAGPCEGPRLQGSCCGAPPAEVQPLVLLQQPRSGQQGPAAGGGPTSGLSAAAMAGRLGVAPVSSGISSRATLWLHLHTTGQQGGLGRGHLNLTAARASLARRKVRAINQHTRGSEALCQLLRECWGGY